MVSMMDAFPPMTFSPEELYPPQQTISLADTTLSACTSAPSSICDMREGGDEKRPVKKRKSWGQELPVPKTNLPPRKRAKTEDEKEQRRIERVLRNRQAAQSSRERKRQEVEKLEGEKSAIETQNDNLRQLLMAAEHDKFRLEQKNKKLTAELAALKGGSASNRSSLAPSPSFSAVDFNDPQAIKQEMEDPLFALRTPISLPSDSFSPSISASTDSRSPSPDSLDMGSHAPTTSPDMTQHPAEMLCDLQCQSGVVPSVAMIRPTIHDRAPSASLSNNNNNNNNNNKDQRAPSPNMLISSHLFYMSFFEDGFTTTEQCDDSSNIFTFDSLVNLDPSEPHDINNIDTHALLQDDEITQLQADLSHPTAPTSPALQPCLGAPSFGRDGSGNAS
ncbi:MAG: hypothetical protein L6R37_006170 [Teloschistes peruensis]|nr:MAG: hypothetical protein L6R37_006170 [Teloschistes peruensis]